MRLGVAGIGTVESVAELVVDMVVVERPYRVVVAVVVDMVELAVDTGAVVALVVVAMVVASELVLRTG